MQLIRNSSTLVLVALILNACAAAGVPYTSDPAAKLADAAQLFDYQGRPLPAEKLIVEAMNQYKDTNNQLGLSEAYRVYGLFFRSRTLNQSNYAAHYREKGFLDPAATYDARYDRSIYYFELSARIFKDTNHLDALSNVYFHLGDVNVLKGDGAAACDFYSQSISAQAAYRVANPQAAGDAVSTAFDEQLRRSRVHAGCT